MITGATTVVRPAAQNVPAGPGLVAGPAGPSAYQAWLDAGNTGPISAFLASLVGAPGATTVGGLTDVIAAMKAVLAAGDLPTARAALGVAVGAQVQAWDADLDAIAALATQAFGRSLLTGADAASARALLGLGAAALLAAGQPGGAATLDGSTGKLVAAQVPDALLGAVRYQGGWNASTNTPALPTPAAANRGFYYIVTVAGTTGQPGPNGAISDWQIGDWAVSDGAYWEKVDSSDQVISVAGLQGAVTAAALKAALAIAGADIADASAVGRALLSAASAAAALSTIGAVAAQAPAGTLKANLTGSTAAVTDQTLSAILDALVGSARGTIAVRGASTWGALALGTSGQTLQSNGADLVYAASAPGAGAVRNDAAQNPSATQIAQALANVGALVTPQGRLTPTSGVPVPTAAVTAAGTVYYTPAGGDLALVGTGPTTAPVPVVFAEVSQALSDATKSPAAAVANMGYDLFAWVDGATFRVTRGPAWTAGATPGTWTAGGGACARGAGAGSTALARAGGVLVNAVAVTNGPAAGMGVYVGTIATDASGATVTVNPGSAAAGGGAAWVGLWNAFNRAPITARVRDTTGSWIYSGSSFRAANGSTGNRATFVLGLADEPVAASYATRVQTVATAVAAIALGLDSVTAQDAGSSQAIQASSAAMQMGLSAPYDGYPGLGLHFLQAQEVADGNSGATFYGQVYHQLAARWRF